MKKLLFLTALFAGSVAWLASTREVPEVQPSTAAYQQPKFDGALEFAKFHRDIRTGYGETSPSYARGYRMKELVKAKARRQSMRTNTANGVTEWIERGPANVPGRTRGLIVDPDDANKNTWFAGSVGGGVWKTTNGGQEWTLITPDLPNLATTVLAMAGSNHNTIYMGTGEGFFNLDAVSGIGMFKSTDRGVTWSHLTSTLEFGDVNRMVVSPSDENVVVVATTVGMFRSTNGGTSWSTVLDEPHIQDLRATPGNFNVLYASQNGVGVWKSTDAGVTWVLSNEGMGTIARAEIAVSPQNPQRLVATAERGFGDGSKMLVSNDGAATWIEVGVTFEGAAIDFLNGQGWYDNTLEFHPFDEDVVYFGGVGVFQLTIEEGTSTVVSYDVEEDGTSFMSFVNFGASYFGGALEVNTDNADASVEVRFGTGQSQKAHRFLVPEGATSGVAAANYSYQDYVEVPFEVWDVTNNRQLMVSFRDQGRDGAFNLILQNTDAETPAAQHSREYIYIHNVDYSASAPNANIAVSGGHEVDEMYFFWPVLAEGANWNPGSLPTSTLNINRLALPLQNATTLTCSDVYSQYDGKNNFNVFGVDVHPDQHNLVMIPMSGSTFKILNANDGGLFISNTGASPGIEEGNWTMVGNTYNTSQFYGADKRTGADEYFGGMQDNGTWQSAPGEDASATSEYNFRIGGDGFEVIWHNGNTDMLIGGSQGNNFARSINGGQTFTNATSGLTGDMPFISKLANSRELPDRIFTLGASGVFVSSNFGQNWTLTPITSKWANSSLMDIEVSRANPNIVWAGTGMNSTLNLHVSVDGGQSFSVTENYTDVQMNGITKLASHPSQENTAYALFSAGGRPKILKTTDLGQSWTDISGFDTNSSSSTGFPDVAVYCLYVRPDNDNIIWAGTEIGIVESLDGGQSWSLLEDFPNVSVWDLKGVDNQIVIATHGRGIWTATLGDIVIPELPDMTRIGTSPNENLAIELTLTEAIDSVRFFVSNSLVGTARNLSPGTAIVELSGLASGPKTVAAVAYVNQASYSIGSISGELIDLRSPQNSLADYFTTLANFKTIGFQLNSFAGQSTAARKTLHSGHPYAANANASALLTVPITVSSGLSNLYYQDVAIVEPNNDFVRLEATSDGINWIPVSGPYNASANNSWQTTFTTGGTGAITQMVPHTVDLKDYFDAGEKILLRFRLTSNGTTQAWGWAIDYLAVQEEPTAVEYTSLAGAVTAHPNPATFSTTVTYELTRPCDVKLDVVDMLGNKLSRIDRKQVAPGKHTEEIATRSLAPGTYLLVLRTGPKTSTVRLVVQ